MFFQSTIRHLLILSIFLLVCVVSCNEDDSSPRIYSTTSSTFPPRGPSGACPPDKRDAGWKWAKGACRPACGTAADFIGYGDYGRDLIQNTPDDPHVWVKKKGTKSCEKLVHFNHTDWREFYFLYEGQATAVSSMETYEVAKDGGVCCVRGVSSDPNLRCPPERKAPHWQWMKNACRPSCGAAALYAGYDGYGEDDIPHNRDDTFTHVLGVESCPEVVRFGHDWKSFSFMDGNIEVSGHDSWNVAQIGGVCCVRGEPSFEPPQLENSMTCPTHKTKPDWEWLTGVCRPLCEVAADLAGHGGYGEDHLNETEDDPYIYVQDAQSCDELTHYGASWKSFSFDDEGEIRSSDTVLDVVRDGGVCCLRDTSQTNSN